ncbi:DUF7344 domain-containing protein [Halorussus lipolyticus]|uniref:DUF7344 domain-containing protein n=1 Tax=Halorussus lipolyticus TaxID=3034024 RepID=UPI0023E7DF75|nr:hypothetical protein [Halorussus sp. DT80]
MKSQRRRYVLYHLRHESGSTDLDVLGRRIAALEAATTGSKVDDESVEAVTVSLFHTHLPKLEDAGLVAYEPQTGAVEFIGADLPGDLLEMTAELEYDGAVTAE